MHKDDNCSHLERLVIMMENSFFEIRASQIGRGCKQVPVYEPVAIDLVLLEKINGRIFKAWGDSFKLKLNLSFAEKPDFNTVGAMNNMTIAERHMLINFNKILKRGRVEDLLTFAKCLKMIFCIAVSSGHGLRYINVNLSFCEVE